MKFIHAVVFDKDEYESAKEWGTDFTDWGQVCDGDYVVHCLFHTFTEDIVIHNDNCHTHVEDEIDAFLKGVRYCGMTTNVQKAYVVVDNGCSYSSYAVIKKLVAGDYVEVND